MSPKKPRKRHGGHINSEVRHIKTLITGRYKVEYLTIVQNPTVAYNYLSPHLGEQAWLFFKTNRHNVENTTMKLPLYVKHITAQPAYKKKAHDGSNDIGSGAWKVFNE